LKKRFWWYGMKREITEYVARCDSCQRIKAEHQRPVGLLQPLQIPQWKWDEIGMDDSRLEGGVNRAKLKFTKIITTTSRVSVRNINESAREGAKQIASK
jgi:hypothetical protein